MKRTASTALAALVTAALILTAAACRGTASNAGAAASASQRVGSALANPTVSSDLTAAEQQLLANLKSNFSPVHPVKSVEAAIKATYPQGSTTKIEAYAVKTFTLAVMHTHGPGSARDTWAQGVVAYAQAQGAQPAVSGTPPAVSS